MFVIGNVIAVLATLALMVGTLRFTVQGDST